MNKGLDKSLLICNDLIRKVNTLTNCTSYQCAIMSGDNIVFEIDTQNFNNNVIFLSGSFKSTHINFNFDIKFKKTDNTITNWVINGYYDSLNDVRVELIDKKINIKLFSDVNDLFCKVTYKSSGL